MNKRPGLDSRRAELEADLIGETLVGQQEKETGRAHVNVNDKLLNEGRRQNAQFHIKQGLRRRHPDRVLHQFKGVSNTTSKASHLFEQALLHENDRTELPQEFRPTNDSMGLTNQMGLVTTAMDNYKKSKQKLERMFLVGV
jgi:hypothetical protein